MMIPDHAQLIQLLDACFIQIILTDRAAVKHAQPGHPVAQMKPILTDIIRRHIDMMKPFLITAQRLHI